MSDKDGGPAFPRQLANNAELVLDGGCGGMSLRDYFAAQALIGILAHEATDLGPPETARNLSAFAFEFADAMLAERAK